MLLCRLSTRTPRQVRGRALGERARGQAKQGARESQGDARSGWPGWGQDQSGWDNKGHECLGSLDEEREGLGWDSCGGGDQW